MGFVHHHQALQLHPLEAKAWHTYTAASRGTVEFDLELS
jgi:N-acetylmuramoyl-L-alanine amidase CwlA